MTPFWPKLRSTIADSVGSHDRAALAIYSADHDEGDVMRRGAGIAAACDAVSEAVRTGRAPPAILLVGVWAEQDLRTRSAGLLGGPVLAWPGLRYLQYCFTVDQLRAAAEAATAGRDAPPPPTTVSELITIAEGVQHWLESLCRLHAGETLTFADALAGKIVLSPRMLSPAPWLSQSHMASLSRLQTALDACSELREAARLAPALAAERTHLRTTSYALEAYKAALLGASTRSEAERLHDLAEAAAARAAVTAALLDQVRSIAALSKGAGAP